MRGRIVGALFGAEPVNDRAIDGACSHRALGSFVGWADLAVGDEDKQVGADSPEHLLQRDAGMRWHGHELAEALVFVNEPMSSIH